MAFKQASYSHIFKFNTKDTLLLWSKFSLVIHLFTCACCSKRRNSFSMSKYPDSNVAYVLASCRAVTHIYPVTLGKHMVYTDESRRTICRCHTRSLHSLPKRQTLNLKCSVPRVTLALRKTLPYYPKALNCLDEKIDEFRTTNHDRNYCRG